MINVAFLLDFGPPTFKYVATPMALQKKGAQIGEK